MKGYSSKEAMAGHRYNMSAKHKRRESEGMKKYWDERGDHRRRSMSEHSDKEVFKHHNKDMYGVDTMSEDQDIGRVKFIPNESRGYPKEAYEYEW